MLPLPVTPPLSSMIVEKEAMIEEVFVVSGGVGKCAPTAVSWSA